MKVLRTTALSLAMFAAIDLAIAENGTAEPLALRAIMKELGRNMQAVTDGIAREDWALVERMAPLIADHPQPPLGEKMRITAFMGSDMPRFKAFDGKTHEAAEELARHAQAKEGQKVIDSFHRLQSACLNCHQAFRTPFVAHFYGGSSN